jgi:hypothetical protein
MRVKIIVLISFAVLLILFSGCLQNIRAPNPELCAKVSQQQNKDTCYHRVALTKGDDLLCSKIIDPNERDNCYLDLAVGRSNFID